MKKSLIALAVAGAMTAPIVAQADATLYGSLRVGVLDAEGSNSFEVKDQSSRIGIKGSVDLYNTDTKGIFRWEQALDTNAGELDGGRLAYIGATGNFGTATIGRQYTPYFNYTWDKTDLFNGEYSDDLRGFANRQGQTIAYQTPEFAGFQAAGMIQAESDDNDSATTAETTNNADTYNVAAKYNVGGFEAALAYAVVEDGTVSYDEDIITAAASYEADDLYVAAIYEEAENAAGENADVDTISLAGSYKMGHTKLIAAYNTQDVNAANFDRSDIMTLEVEQKVGKKARVFAQYTNIDSDGEDNGFYKAGELKSYSDALSVGYRVDF